MPVVCVQLASFLFTPAVPNYTHTQFVCTCLRLCALPGLFSILCAQHGSDVGSVVVVNRRIHRVNHVYGHDDMHPHTHPVRTVYIQYIAPNWEQWSSLA